MSVLGEVLHQTGRTGLRRVEGGDLAEFTRLAALSRDLHRPWIKTPKTPAEFEEYLARHDRVAAEGLVAYRLDTGALAGFVNVNEIVRGPYDRATIGYGVFAPAQRRGYMSEALELVMRFAFGDLGLHRLEADIQPQNERSLALVRRVGFRKEGFSPGLVRIDGCWRDHERWAITSDLA